MDAWPIVENLWGIRILYVNRIPVNYIDIQFIVYGQIHWACEEKFFSALYLHYRFPIRI